LVATVIGNVTVGGVLEHGFTAPGLASTDGIELEGVDVARGRLQAGRSVHAQQPSP
jgi:hypothetical protein